MTKNQNIIVQNTPKNQNLLVLHKLLPLSDYLSVSANFTPFYKSNNHFQSIIPQFNHDHHYFTPAFCLPNENIYYINNPQFELQRFLERIIKAEQKKTDQLEAQPINPSSSHCQVCKTSYQNYQEHINSKNHKRKSKSSKANQYIKQLCSQIRRIKKKQQKRITRIIKKSQTQFKNSVRKSQRIMNKVRQRDLNQLGGIIPKSSNNNSTNLASWDFKY